MESKILFAFVKQHPQKYTHTQIAAHFNVSEDLVRGRIKRAGLKHLVKPDMGGIRSLKGEVMGKTVKQLTHEARLEILARNEHKEVLDIGKKYRVLQNELSATQKALTAALKIQQHQPVIVKIKAPDGGKNGSGTVVACLSDVHSDELVPSNKVNGLNEHNPDISKRRVHKFFELVVKFIRVDRQETAIDNLVLWLGGDFFTSDSHGAPTAFPPMIAAMFAQDLLASGIEFIRKHEPNLTINIVGSVGNHSRKDMMKPVNQALEQEHSLEWMMYHALKARYASDKVHFTLHNGYNTYIQTHGKMLRFNHGHLGWRYNDGLGGVHGPLWKVISQKWDKQIKADLTICGHYHTYTPSSLARGYMVNGSVIGATPYSLNFGYEAPAQAYFLVHSKYGIVGQRPIFVDS